MKDENENLGTNTESYEDYIPDGDNYIEDNSYQGQNVSSMNQNNVFTPGTNGVGPIGDNGLHKGINGFKSNNINNNNNFKKDNAKNNKDNPAMGNNKKDNANSKRNPALGQNNNQKQDGNKMPGAKKNDNNKNAKDGDPRKRQEPNKKDDKTKSKSKNKINKNLLPSGINPFNRGSKNSSSASKTAKDAMKKGRVKGAKMLWTVTPIPVKVAVVASISIMLIAFLLLAAFGVSTATGVAVAASLCGSSDSTANQYNGQGYTGSANDVDFMCGMQDPLGEKPRMYSSKYKKRWGRQHRGYDLANNNPIPVYAVQNGEVLETGNDGNSGRGQYVTIGHGDKIKTQYYHLSKIIAKKGDTVAKGQKIGLLGSTGNSTGPHLHFQIDIDGTASPGVNDYFGKETTTLVSRGATQEFKKLCGSKWDGELAGESANEKNEDVSGEDFSDETSSSDAKCCTSDSSDSATGDADVKASWDIGALVDRYGGNPKTFTVTYYDDWNWVADQGKLAKSGKVYADKVGFERYQVGSSQNEKEDYYMIALASKFGKKIGNKYRLTVKTAKGKIKEIVAILADQKADAHTGTHHYYTEESKCYCEWEVLRKTGLSNAASAENGPLEGDGAELQKIDLIEGDIVNDEGDNGTCIPQGASFDGPIVKYTQIDPKWANESYGSYGTIGSHGCGTTAMAMVVSTFTKQDHNPVELTNLACSNGYCTSGGTSHAFFAFAGKKYDLSVNQTGEGNEVLTALNSGNALVIAIMGPGTFTSGGHFILLYGIKDGKVLVQDPAGINSKPFDFSLIEKETSKNTSNPFWIIRKK